MRTARKTLYRQSGMALLTTMLLMLLMSTLLVGFILLITSGQKLSGMNNDQSRAFYAAEAGMEKMTADIGSLFDANYSPSGAELAALQTTPPALSGVSFVNYTGTTGSGYTITFPKDGKGNPLATVTQIKSGNYQGMMALATPYTLNVTAHTASGSEVKLQRTTQTVGIPIFQFGVFSDLDLSFFAGPRFDFGGRTHTNGNLFIHANNGPLTLSDRVTVVKDVIRATLENGYLATGSSYGGTVNVFNGSGTRALGLNEGSLSGGLGSSPNPNWNNISLGSTYYAGNLRAASTGPGKPLQLGIVTLGSGTTQAVDVLRRPIPGESNGVTAERYFAQASLKVLLSDNPNDITTLPCIDSTVAPFDLSSIALPVANWSNTGAPNALKTLMVGHNNAGLNTPPVPLAASGAAAGAASYNSADGYWLPTPNSAPYSSYTPVSGVPIIKGFIKIEVQDGTTYNTLPCGSWKDVTLEVLSYGYAGKNINPIGGLVAGTGYSTSGVNPPMPGLTTTIQPSQQAAGSCPEVHPNAIIRLERVRDNPSTYGAGASGNCGTLNDPTPTNQVFPKSPTDYWPNSFFDTREGTLRDSIPASGGIGGINYQDMVSLNGVMQYVELDANNLVRYLTGKLAGSGTKSYDPVTAPNDYSVYLSDRRGNYIAAAPITPWPPVALNSHETGEFGFQDFVNSLDKNGCPNSAVDPGEDLDGLGTGTLFTYGQDASQVSKTYQASYPSFTTLGGNGYYGAGSASGVNTALVGSSTTNALTQHPSCNPTTPTAIWPFNYVLHANDARQNPNFFFRRAVKIVNGRDIANVMNTCPTGVLCGLTIAAENPVYVQGDYNCFGGCSGVVYNDPHIAASIAGDAVTLLSNNWNDVNSFISPYYKGGTAGNIVRNATTSYYRTALISGKGVYFPRPTGYATSADFGTDGGLHNFLRYVENWGGQTLNYRGSLVSLFYNRQATGIFKCCATVYSPPSRGYNFDVEFLQPQLLPPRTPLFRDVNTTGFTQLLLPTQ